MTSLALPTSARIWIGGHNRRAYTAVEPLFTGTSRPPGGEVDGLILTPLTFDEFLYFADKHLVRLGPLGKLGLVTLDPNGEVLRASAARWASDIGLEYQQQLDLESGVRLDVWIRPTSPPPQPRTG